MGLKKQHILVLIQDIANSDIAIKYSFKLAKIHNAEVAFLHYQNNSPQLSIDFIKKFNTEDIAYKFVTFGKKEDEPNNCIQQLDAIFMLTQFSNSKINSRFKKNPIFKLVHDAKIPTILVSENTNPACDFKNIIIPVDHRRETKEKMIWASYFGRFNKAVIHLIAPDEKSQVMKRRIDATLLFTKKMYEQFTFEYRITKASSSSYGIHKASFKLSKEYQSDLIVLLASPGSWFSNYFGPWKIKKYLQKESNPILLINPLKDYYIPCR